MPKDLTKMNKDIEVPARFKPRARLLIQLGDQLIKNESIALIELVKNSYDADANIVNIYMENVDDPIKGVIIIEDDGYGMSPEIVENVWLEPGGDFKSIKIKNNITSPKHKRLPIGEKGIGRFGVHKLGNIIELTTKAKDTKEVFVKINWSDFDNYKYLEEVPIKIIEREKPLIFKDGKTGTNIVISSLKKEWERGVARNIKRSITALTSPFDSKDSFKASFDIIDKPGWFEGLLNWEDVSQFSLFNFEITLEDNLISEFKYNFEPWASMPKLSTRNIHFVNDSKKKDNLEEKLIEELSLLKNSDGKDINLKNHHIGKITFKGYVFDRDSFVLRLGVADKQGFKNYLNSNCGIRVFRDGMRVYDYGEPENDWLGLDYRRFMNPSKHMSNNIILGAIYLERSASLDLQEKTNREGFIENKAYLDFKDSILHSIGIVETLRFEDKKRLRESYGPTTKSEPVMQVLGDLKDFVDKNVKDEPVKKEISKYLVKIESDYKRINETLLKAAGAGLSMSVVIHEVEKIIVEVQKVLVSEKSSDRVIKLVKHLSSLVDGYSSIISKSSQTNESLKDIVNQALFNTEYRLSSHKIIVDRAFEKYKGTKKFKVASNLMIGSIMNIIDNSIYWLENAYHLNKKLEKRLFINITEEEGNYINIIIADNGNGFLLPTSDVTEPFVSSKPGGMGLGLHIVNEIMLAQGGKIGFPNWGDFEIPKEFKNGAIVSLGFKI